MEVNYSGLKCDNCSYRDDTVPFSDYKASIGKPCPECGHSLLTEKDYKSCLRITNTINGLNNILKWFNPFYYLGKLFKWGTYSISYTFKNKNI